jgi:tetratricopeptide (TPR) repeat protein
MRLYLGLLCVLIGCAAQAQKDADLARARLLYDHGKYKEAIALLDKLIDGEEGDFDVLLAKGDCLQKEEKYVAALQAYQQAELLNGANAPLLTNQGAAYLNLQQLDEAEKKLKRAIKIDPTHPEAHYFMGSVQYFGFSMSAAIKHYSEAIKLRPQYRDALYMRAASYAELGKYREALRDYEAALSADPNLEVARFNMAVIYLEVDEYNRAASMLESIDPSKLPSAADYYYNLGEALYFAGKKTEACEHYQMAARLGDVDSKELYTRYCIEKETREALRKKRTIKASF